MKKLFVSTIEWQSGLSSAKLICAFQCRSVVETKMHIKTATTVRP